MSKKNIVAMITVVTIAVTTRSVLTKHMIMIAVIADADAGAVVGMLT